MPGVNQHYDVIVVGGGVIGSAILHRISARLGARALLVEQGRMGQGSTGWSGGVVRCYHGAAPQLADMACDGLDYYSQFAHHTGSSLSLRRSGYVHMIYPDQAEAAQREVARLAARIAIEWLPRQQAKARFPAVCWDDLAGAVVEAGAGYMDPHAVTKDWIAAARGAGSVAMEGIRCAGVLTQGARAVGIQTSLGQCYASNIVICAGAWSGKLAVASGLALPEPVQVKAIQLNVFASERDLTEHPAFIDPGAGLYGRAEGRHRLYLGMPVSEWDIDPDAPADLSLAHVVMTQAEGSARFPWLAQATPAGGMRRFDAYTASELPLVAPSVSTPGLIWATGFSGGGFKLAPAIATQVQHLLS